MRAKLQHRLADYKQTLFYILIMSRLRNSSFDEAKELFKGIPGIQMDMNDKLTVVFKK